MASASPRSNLFSSLSYPFEACAPSLSRQRGENLPSSVRAAQRDDPTTPSSSAHQDSDAISLLSNIAARGTASSRARAAQQRAQQRRREARGRHSGMCGLGDWASELLAGGLFGRSSSSRSRPAGRGSEREDRVRERRYEDVMAEDPLLQEEDEELLAGQLSEALVVGNGDEDARSIAVDSLLGRVRLGQPSLGTGDVNTMDSSQHARTSGEEDFSAAQAAEEARLAVEEERIIVEGQRRALEKAARQGLLRGVDLGNESAHRCKAEAEARAEAAAGGFDSDEEIESWDAQDEDDRKDDEPQALQRQDREHYESGAKSPLFRSSEEDSYTAESSHIDETGRAGPTIIHHHHHYYDHPDQSAGVPTILAPPAEGSEASQEEQDEEAEADMAGLGFGSKKSRKRLSGSSNSAGAGASSCTFRGSGSDSASASAVGSGSHSRKSGQKYYPYAQAPTVDAAASATGAATAASASGSGSGSNRSRGRYQLPKTPRGRHDPFAETADDDEQDATETLQGYGRPSRATRDEDDSAADAAAGGFDELDVPHQTEGYGEDQADWLGGDGGDEKYTSHHDSDPLGSSLVQRGYREKRRRFPGVHTNLRSEAAEETDGA